MTWTSEEQKGYSILDGKSLLTSLEASSHDRYDTPNYYVLLRTGQILAPLPYTAAWKKEISPAVQLMTCWGSRDYPTSFLQSYPSGLGFDDSGDDSYNKAVESFYSNAKSFESSVAVSVAELPKAITMIGNTAKDLACSFHNLKRLKVGRAFDCLGLKNSKHNKYLTKLSSKVKNSSKGKLDFASNAWLEMTYGWKPLLGEIDNAMKDLASRYETEPSDFRIRGSGTSSGSAPNAVYLPGWKANGHTKIRSGIICDVRVTSDIQRDIQGIGITNPLEIAWEVLPFSFVVDWFIPMQSWISSFNVLDGIEFIRGSRQTLIRRNWTAEVTYDEDAGFCNEPIPMKINHNGYHFERKVLHGFPSNLEIFYVTGIQDALGINRSTSAIALLYSVFGR